MTHSLLLIDPQNDFCDIPNQSPALAVGGAHADMQRLSQWLREHGAEDILVTLDSHHRVGIERPGFWKNVQPFTQIALVDVLDGKYQPKNPEDLPKVVQYLTSLEEQGRFKLMVWPVHCEIGTWGHNIHSDVQRAIAQWEEDNVQVSKKVFKGMNPWTEHYSALRAEVVTEDEHTQTNMELLRWAQAQEKIYVAGEASSHCVRYTVKMLIEEDPGLASKLVILVDCMSPVGGFEASQQAFFDNVQKLGARLEYAAPTSSPEYNMS